MIKEAYCSYEVAKLLKEKGFDEPCYMSYWLRTKDSIEFVHLEQSGNKYSDCLYAPTHQMACAWLREKGYHIFTYRNQFKTWSRDIQELNTGVEWTLGGFESHAAAVEEALKCTLENLI